ncbi:MAG: ATP synthase F0 subunit A [Planctomycetota bacterium]|nr:MAG: ATP synthase F0 subunit A [Planctomycetota bacterium]REK26260.1 MAG: ATP synthase F0 subunit A [Planctomycetota bacterium]REK34392.1 MAG: ATP synthase F0 subunit A [Planctomycetota bacterium]
MASGTFHHVYDFAYFELPFGIELPLPNLFGMQITKFMVLQLVVFLITLFIFRGLSQRIAGGKTASGWWWNFWEMLALYIRDEVVRPIIGDPHHHDHTHEEHNPLPHGEHQHPFKEAEHIEAEGRSSHNVHGGHPADKYLPFVWSCFFYILIANLLGAVPWMGSVTGDLNVTAALALTALAATYIYGAQVHGFVGFWPALVPSIDAPGLLKPILVGMLFAIEVLGFFIKHAVLCVRLFANIMGGHTVLGVLLGFLAMTAHLGVWWIVAPGSIAGQVGVGLLELLVAFIQAYVFAFLATIFIGMSLHEH